MGFDFSLVDVFTDRPFGGNRLAVFPDATGIADATMQQLAWEFNFSETTFVLPPSDPSCTCGSGSSPRARNCRSPVMPPLAPPPSWPA
jgi:hypothetical protein